LGFLKHMKGNTKYIIGIALLVIVVLFAWYYAQPAKYADFAQCLADEEATFFGAFWCPACEEQKRLFGRAEGSLPYEECSTPDRQGQLQVCIDEGITSYPTWEFADGERAQGVVSLEDLSEKTGCDLPV